MQSNHIDKTKFIKVVISVVFYILYSEMALELKNTI